MFIFLEKFLKSLFGDSVYKKNVAIMVSGRVLAQAIPILLTPLLTRLYSPSEFGIFGVYAAIIAFLAMISNGRYSLSIILPKSDIETKRLLILSSFLTIVVTAIFALGFIALGSCFFDFFEISMLQKYLPILILNILFIGLYESLYYYVLRTKNYKILTTNIIIQALVLVSIRLLCGYLNFTEIGLIISYLIGYSVGYILLISRLKIPIFSLFKEFKIFDYILLLKRYSRFPKYSLLADSLSVLATYSPNMLLNKIFGSVVTGYYSMSDKILGSPIWFVTSSVGDVFKQEASEQLRVKNSCFEVFVKTTKTLFFIGIIPFSVLFIISPYVVPFILGENWKEAGVFIQIFSIMYFLRFIISPVSHVIYIVNKQNYNVIFQGINLLTTVISFGLGLYFKDLYLCLISLSVLTSISYIIVFIYSYKFAKESKYEENKES